MHADSIRNEAFRLGFDHFGVAKADRVSDDAIERVERWIERGAHASMGYMTNNREKRYDPRLLVEGAQSIVMVGMNYYPVQVQQPHLPQVSYYAYGTDYHTVMKEKLHQLFYYIKTLFPEVEGRAFTDSAPVLERYWAEQCGIGWIGRSRQLITTSGTCFFLGELILTIPLTTTPPTQNRCGSCQRCIEACPTNALSKTCGLDANRCLSYRTIEHKGAFDDIEKVDHGNRLFGCDECQKACPWNRFATPSPHPELALNPAINSLDKETIEQMDAQTFNRLFKLSPIKRIKLEGLKRNAQHLNIIDVI